MDEIKIEFDGGNSCNIPRLGYGNGYGSYKVNNNENIKIEFGIPMSNNVAEIMTLVTALDYVLENFGPSNIFVRGDSKIALNWINKAKNKFIKYPEDNPNYSAAAKKLVEVVNKHKVVREEWRGRKVSVELFGH